MEDSILESIKKELGGEINHTGFDMPIITQINSAIMVLNQIGVGTHGFRIEDNKAKWEDLLGDRTDLESVKTYIYLKTKLVFDPPSSSFLVDAFERSIKELEYRLRLQMEVEPNGEDR